MKKIVALFFIFTFLLGIFIPFFSFGQSVDRPEGLLSISLTPLIKKIELKPGEVYNGKIEVFNKNPETFYFHPKAFDFKGKNDGRVVFLSQSEIEIEPFLLSDWIEIKSTEIEIAPFSSGIINYQIKVPENAPPGDKYALISASLLPPKDFFDDTTVWVSPAVSTLFMISVDGDIIEKARIKEFYTDKIFYTNLNVLFTATVENIGNVYIHPRGEINIYNIWGDHAGHIPINFETAFGNVLAQSERSWNFIWQKEETILESGKYKAILTLVYGEDGGVVTNYKVVEFWVLTKTTAKAIIIILSFLVFLIFCCIRLTWIFQKRKIRLSKLKKMSYNKK